MSADTGSDGDVWDRARMALDKGSSYQAESDALKERLTEILGLAAHMGSLHLERVAHEAIAGLAAVSCQSLAEQGFLTRENLNQKGNKFMQATKRGVVYGSTRGFRRREAKL